MEDLATRLRRIEEQITDLTHAGALLGCPEFVEVYSQPEAHVEGVLEALRAPETSELHKAIAALSMQRLPLQKFVEFSERILGSRETGLVSERVFDIAIFPTYDWNTMLAENYADPAVRRLLNRILTSPAVSDACKAHVRDEILSGNARTAVLELRAAGQIP